MEVARLEDVSRVFKVGAVETWALRGVNLSIHSGEFTALVGPSGSGKTTLLQLIGCLDLPTSGRVFINGKDVSTLNRDQRADVRRGTIGFIFQFFALIPTLTAYENVEMPLLLIGQSAASRRARVMQLLDTVGLSDRAHHRPDQLSGGEQQRVAIARALAPNPSLILADEPTANLDTPNGKQVMDLMARLNQATGVTFVFATHDPRVIQYARRIVTLRDGHIVEMRDVQPPQPVQTEPVFVGR
ncbi:MAG: ABC transporter ATP-binding protein [Anaerolineae bacterium]|nr:ABC transporter ATP-binding protein [Thermoflexales bacterium]MDW8407959.1 ABC transporter ATP-binding protein [Anaerolineae bacterium]